MANELLKDDVNGDIDDVFDTDICDVQEIDRIFNAKCKHVSEKPVDLDKKYVLYICGTQEVNPTIGVGLSDKSCEIFKLSDNQIAKVDSINDHVGSIVGVQFSQENPNLFYTGSSDGHVKLWDLRSTNKAASTFGDTTLNDSSEVKPLTCFDVSPNNRLLGAGTELFDGDAFILLWDVRNTKLLGGYWESHMDDITQLKFHPTDVNRLISGSTDGLINIYDLSQTCEDDALTESLNTESSIEQLHWYEYNKNDAVCCVTHTVDVQLWRSDDAEPYCCFKRGDFAKEIRRQSEEHCYIASVHTDTVGNLFILAGSNFNDGECLRAVKVNQTKLLPNFTLTENKQRVRCSWFNKNVNLLVTGGERGILNVWNLSSS